METHTKFDTKVAKGKVTRCQIFRSGLAERSTHRWACGNDVVVARKICDWLNKQEAPHLAIKDGHLWVALEEHEGGPPGKPWNLLMEDCWLISRKFTDHITFDELTKPKAPQRRIVCAAHFLGGEIICSPRHFDPVARAQMKNHPLKDQWSGCAQGFVDQYGIYLSREDAWPIAQEAKQIIRDINERIGTLYSEHLY